MFYRLRPSVAAPPPLPPPQALDEYLPTPGRVLDLGCGTSRLAEHLAQLGHTVDAVDNSTEAIALCSARMRADPLGERPVAFLVADLTAMACYEPGDFDCAVDKSTLDCLDCLGLAGKAASETHRVLKAGGLLVSVSCRFVSGRSRQCSPSEHPLVGRASSRLLADTFLSAPMRRQTAAHSLAAIAPP